MKNLLLFPDPEYVVVHMTSWMQLEAMKMFVLFGLQEFQIK